MEKKEKRIKSVISYLLCFLIMLLLSRATVMGVQIPFSSAFAFSLILLNRNAVLVSICYFVGFLVLNLTFDGLVISLSVVSSLLLLYLISKIIRKQIKFTVCLLFCLLGQVGYAYFHLNSPIEIVLTCVSIFVSLMFFYVCYRVCDVVFNRGIQSRLTIDENICLSIFLIAIFSGLSNLYLFNFSITNTIAFLTVFILGKTLSKTSMIYVASLMGFGWCFSTGSPVYISIYVTWAIVGSIFKDYQKIIMPIAVLIVDLVLGLFLKTYAFYSYLNILSLCLAGAIYMLIPEKIYKKLSGYSYAYEGSLANEYIITGQKTELREKLIRISKLFSQMQNTYRTLNIGEIDRNKAKISLAEDIVFKHCRNCRNYHKCTENVKIKESICQLFEYGFAKGKVTIIDANNLLTSECLMVTSLINEVNKSLETYFKYEKRAKREDDHNLLIANQFGGTGEIFNELGEFVFGGEKINVKYSKILLDELTLNQIVCNEVIVLEKNSGIYNVILIVRNTDALSSKILLSLKSVFKLNFTLKVCRMTRFAGWSVVCFVPASRYDVGIGFAKSSKTPDSVSGDNYSILKINQDKLLFAISDGKGHGEKASEISGIALDLIEAFYKSGFSSETILTNINNILLPAGEENFTTIDACVFDKNNGSVDFIKMGASCSVIKSQDTSRLVTQDTLPLGIIEKPKFKVQKVILKEQDVVVLASDGIVDSFDNIEEYLNYVNNERVINVQMLAESILEEAESRTKIHNDDKTIIVFKVGANV